MNNKIHLKAHIVLRHLIKVRLDAIGLRPRRVGYLLSHLTTGTHIEDGVDLVDFMSGISKSAKAHVPIVKEIGRILRYNQYGKMLQVAREIYRAIHDYRLLLEEGAGTDNVALSIFNEQVIITYGIPDSCISTMVLNYRFSRVSKENFMYGQVRNWISDFTDEFKRGVLIITDFDGKSIDVEILHEGAVNFPVFAF